MPSFMTTSPQTLSDLTENSAMYSRRTPGRMTIEVGSCQLLVVSGQLLVARCQLLVALRLGIGSQPRPPVRVARLPPGQPRPPVRGSQIATWPTPPANTRSPSATPNGWRGRSEEDLLKIGHKPNP